jgi:predicted RNA-binding Zn-ribbon protein involved in translation (DUF1610 family)
MSANSADVVRVTEKTANSTARRLHKALGPAVPGLLLDLVDLAALTRTAGPVVSIPIGFAIGVWLSLYYPIGLGWRSLIAIGASLYVLVPGTEYIPLATLVTCLCRFVEGAPTSPMNSTAAVSSTSLDPAATPTADESISPREQTGPLRAKCPECGSMELRYGSVAESFVPTGSSIWSKGHEIHAFVCLECGFVGHYLASDDLERLRAGRPAG